MTTGDRDAERQSSENRALWRFSQKLGITIAAVVVGWALISAIHVWLLVFAAVLFAIVLNRASCSISTRTPLSRRWALALVSFTSLTLIVLTGWLMSPAIGRQVQELQQSVPQSLNRLQEQLSEHAWGEKALKAANTADQFLPDQGALLKRATGMFTSTVSVFGAFTLVVFLGICFAIEPSIYTEGLLYLFPQRFRPRGREIFDEIEESLAHWLLARSASMTLAAALVGLSLWLLKIPLAFTLALLAGVFDFIPNLGPFISAAPAVLLGFLISPMKALHVALALFAVYVFEGYVFTPVVERKAVKLPPALTATMQILLGLSAGILGVALAAPLTATTIVLVKELYVRDYLGDRSVGISHRPDYRSGKPVQKT
ncbi:AI-2E family transporter [Verrucomicrobiota bacterium sgz303538]